METLLYEHEPIVVPATVPQRQEHSYRLGTEPADRDTIKWHPSGKYLLTRDGVVPLTNSRPPSEELRLRNVIFGGADWIPNSTSIVTSIVNEYVPQSLSLTSIYDFDPKTLVGKEFGMVNFAPAWEPHGKRIAFLSYKRKVLNSTSPNLCVMRIGGKPRTLMERIWFRTPLWSPKGRQCIVERRGGEGLATYLVDVDTGKSRCILRAPLSSPAMSYGTHGEAYTLNPLQLPMDRLHSEHTFAMDWSPDGKYLLIAYREGGYYAPSLLNLESGKVELLLPIVDRAEPDRSSLEFFTKWSPDGKYIAYSYYHSKSQTERIVLVDVGTRAVRKIYQSAEDTPDGIAWSPDGKTLAVLAYNPRKKKILLISTTGMQKPVATLVRWKY
jgi:WD40 repeat protein